MAQAVEDRFGGQIHAGWINVKDGHLAPLRHIHQHQCSHPIPDPRGEEGARQMLQLLSEVRAEDTVVVLISGGASALLPLPITGIRLEEKQKLTDDLLRCGATIHEINAVRKHISQIKGGLLCRAAQPARVRALLLSDVTGDPPDVIGSGPTAPDSSTFGDALAVLNKYGIQPPESIHRHLHQSEHETPKPGDPIFARVENIVVGSNAIALEAAQRRAEELGYKVVALGSDLGGEARVQAMHHLDLLAEFQDRPLCLLSGGECVVTLTGSGKGGRNQEFVLAAVDRLRALKNTVVFSAGTDGTDGPTDAAGAIVDSESAQHLPPTERALANHDSYHYFQDAGGLVFTGPTGTNVMDIRVILATADPT
jgi:glycerate 2-kinase